MNNNTIVYLQSIIADFVMDEKQFTMGDLIYGKHLDWCKEQLQGQDGLCWIACSRQPLNVEY